MDRSSSQNGGR